MTRPFRPFRPLRPLAFLLLLLAAGLPAGAASAPGAGPVGEPIDPVVQEVVRMLDGGVAEPVIDSWLESADRHPSRVDSAELVALQKAKASPDLMKRLIQAAKSRATRADQPPPQPPAPEPPMPAPAPPPAAAPPPPAAGAVPPPPSGGIPVRFQLGYRPFSPDEGEPAWNLFVYLDGRFLAWAKPSAISLTTRSESFDRALPAGRHVIRMVEERHLRRGRHGWENEARVAPTVLAFDLAPGELWRVQLQLDQLKINRKGPVSLRATSGDREMAAAAGGGEPETWPALCEDLEAGSAAGKPPSAEVRRRLGHCVRWESLFPAVAGVPPRDQVRAELERDSFEPPPPGAASR